MPPLRLEFPLVLIAVGLISGVIALRQAVDMSRKAVEAEFTEAARLMSVLTMSRIEAATRVGETTGVRNTVERLNFDRNLLHAVLINENNRISESTDYHLRGASIEALNLGNYGTLVREARKRGGIMSTISEDGNRLITANTVPGSPGLTTDDDFTGYVLMLEHDLTRVRAEHRSQLLEAGTRALFPVIGLALTIGLLLRYAVYNRVAFLERQLDEVSLIENPPLEPLTGRDEFAGFSRSIDRVARELRERTEDLRISEERFALAMAGANDGVWDWELKTDKVFLSPRWKEMLGYRDEELPNAFSTWRNLLHEDDRAESEAAVGRFVSGEEEDFNIEFRLRHKDGTYREILSRAFTVRRDGKAIRLVGTHVDLTERKEAERRIQALNETLESKVQRRTRELQLANRELESFAYTVSHDLSAPLRGIRGFSEALEEDCSDELSDAARTYLGRIRKSASTLSDMIEAILQLSRITRGHVKPVSVDLSALANELAEEISLREPERHVDWQIEEGIKVQGDRPLLRVVLQNLLTNSWKFTRDRDEVEIIFRRSPNRDGASSFEIRDNGVGFDASKAEKMFQPFQRYHSQAAFQGHGIGLATVKRIIDRHDGEIRVKSEKGAGTSVFFSIGDVHVDAPENEEVGLPRNSNRPESSPDEKAALSR